MNRMNRMFGGIMCCLFCLSLISCGVVSDEVNDIALTLDESKDELVRDLNRTIDQLGQSPAAWESAATNLINEIEGSSVALAQSLSNEIQTIIDQSNRTVANAGVEFRCNSDFVGKRLEERLKQFRDAILNGNQPGNIAPWICHVFPNEIELDVINGRFGTKDPTVTVYGFNFTSSGLPNAQIVNQNGAAVSTVPVVFNSPYQISVNVQGATLDRVQRGAKVKLDWPTSAVEYRESGLFLILPTPTTRPTPIPTQTPIPSRSICLGGEITLNDDETFGSDEKDTYPVNQCIRLLAGDNHTFNIRHCTGDEVVIDIEVIIDLRQNLSTDGTIMADLFEGSDCYTSDLEDTTAPNHPSISAPPNGKGPSVNKRLSSDGMGGGDWADISLHLTVSP